MMQKRAGFHRLKLNHAVRLMRLARLFGFKIEDLAADHAAQTSRARQARTSSTRTPGFLWVAGSAVTSNA